MRDTTGSNLVRNRALHVALGTLIVVFFFGDSLVDYGLVPDFINFIPELLILWMCGSACVRGRRYNRQTKPVGLGFAFAFVGVTLASAAWAQSPIVSTVLFLRIVLRFYVMFWALTQLSLSEQELRAYLRLLAGLFLIQIPVAAVKLALYGQGESAIGTYATHGGGNSTAISMIASGFLLTYYYAYRRSIWCLLGIVGFTAFGVMGGKRAIFMMVPLICLFAVFNVHTLAAGRRRSAVHLYLLAGMISALVFYLGVRLSPTLTPEREVGGSFDLDHLYSYVRQYETAETEQNSYTTGRFSTTVRSVSIVLHDPMTAILGLGPGRVMKSRVDNVGRAAAEGFHGARFSGADVELGIMYGFTGFSWLLLQVGLAGTVVWLCFFAYLLALLRRQARWESDPFWRYYYLGMVCFTFVVLLISLTYGSYMIAGDLMTFIYFLLLAIGNLHGRQAGRYCAGAHANHGTALQGWIGVS